MEAHVAATDAALGRLVTLLTELAGAVDADLGATLHLPDGEGVLHAVATSEHDRGARRRPRLFGGDRGERAGATTMVAIPDARQALVVLQRARVEPFSQDDHAVARLFARQLAEKVIVEGVGSRASTWSRQLEAVQSVASQLTRLTSVEGITTALCVETRRVIPYDNVRVHLLADDGRTLEAIAFRGHDAFHAG